MEGPGWVAVLPVKPLALAKSRLREALPAAVHPGLVLAMAVDTAAAVRACPAVVEVIVVTDDPAVRAALVPLDIRVVPDRPAAGLNAAIRHGRRAARHRAGDALALTADLPALRPAELDAVLAAMRVRSAEGSAVRGYVPDAAGTGTTALLAVGVPLRPRFGPGSAAAHAATGATALLGPWPSVRRDVDTGRDLAAAVGLGLGPRSAAALAPARPRYGAGVQGTVATYDPAERSGSLLLDDGTEVAFPPAAFDASGLRLLRPGQRVRVDRDADGRVSRVTLPTFGTDPSP